MTDPERTNNDATASFVHSGLPIFGRYPDRSAVISCNNTCGRTPHMLADGVPRPRHRGAPPPGNRTNWSEPASAVEMNMDIGLADVIDQSDGANPKWGFDVRGEESSVPQNNNSSNGTVRLPDLEEGTTSLAFNNDDADYDAEDVTEDDTDDDGDGEDDDEDEIEDDLEQIDLEEVEDDPLIVSKAVAHDDFEDDDDVELTTIATPRSRKTRRKPSRKDITLTGMDLDSNDDIVDEEDELLEVESELLAIGSVSKSKKSRTIVPSDSDEEPTSSDMLIDEEFEDPSEAELQSAAEMLTGTGLLGRATGPGDDLGKSKSGRLLAPDEKSKSGGEADMPLLNFDPEEEDELGLEEEEEEEEKKPVGLEGYRDLDDEEEAEFTLTSNTEGSFGRVWELNEDSYVTITEPGQTYAYELDEVDSDDQEMASIRRGAQGGWGSGLQNDAKNKYPVGSREWIARRSYDLISKASAREMRMWTKRQGVPPKVINDLYPEPAGPQAILGICKLDTYEVDEQNLDDEFSRDERAVFGSKEMLGSSAVAKEEDKAGNVTARSALERAVKFPCSFKFKVEGTGGEALVSSLTNDVARVLNQKLPRSAFTEEPSGRYTRVIFAVEVAEARHVTDLYDAFRQNPMVKFSYG